MLPLYAFYHFSFIFLFSHDLIHDSPAVLLNIRSLKILAFCTILCVVIPAFSQDKLIFIGGGYRGGSPYKDNRFSELVNYTNGFEVGLVSKRRSFREWESFLHNPQIEMGIKYTDFGNRYLGHNISGFYTLGMPLWKVGDFTLRGVFGGGVGYFSEKYSKINNPINVAISTNFTILIRFGAMIQYSMNNWLLSLRWDLDHYSVAAISQPNLGLNHNTFGLMVYRKLHEKSYHRQEEVFLNNNLNFVVAVGAREVQNSLYPHLNIYAFYALPLSKFISISMGGSFFRNQSLKEEQRIQMVNAPMGFRSGVMAGLQLNFDKVTTNIHIGRYLLGPEIDGAQYYQQFLMRYQLSGPWGIASSLVAHNFNVSYTLDAGISYAF